MYNVLTVMFLILGIRVYRRGKKTVQRAYILKFFFYISASLIINVFYAVIADSIVQRIGNNTVLLLTTMGVANLMLFTLSLRFSKDQLTRSKSRNIELIVLAACLVYYFIPDGTIILLPDYSPYWTLPFLVYGMILTQILMVTTLFFGFSIYKQMKNQMIRLRYKYFLIGLFFIEIVLVSTFLGNGQLLDKSLRIVLALAIIPAAFLIYAGVGRQLSQE